VNDYSLLECRRTEAGLEVRYDRRGEDKIVVTAEIMRDPSFCVALPSLAENWGLVRIDEPTPWPGDTVYRVTKPGAKTMTIVRY
jgi:hypothetical protein